MCYKNDAERSIRAFDKFTRHALNRHFGGNALIRSFEGSDNPVERIFDMKFGMDGIIVTADNWTHKYASRVQFGVYHGTFTIRGYRPSGTATEIHKLRRVDEPKPDYHVQTYVDSDGRGAVVGICETTELMQYIDRHKPAIKFARDGGQGFYPVPFADLAGVRVYYVDACGNVEDVTKKK